MYVGFRFGQAVFILVTTGSWGYTILLAQLYLGYACVGFRYSQAVFILVMPYLESKT